MRAGKQRERVPTESRGYFFFSSIWFFDMLEMEENSMKKADGISYTIREFLKNIKYLYPLAEFIDI